MFVPIFACSPAMPRAGALRGWAARQVMRLHAVLAPPGPTPWTLAPRCAASWHPPRCSTLTVTAGQAWVTLRAPLPRGGAITGEHDSASRDSGDYFLQAGDSLPVAAGQHVVLEVAGVAYAEGFVAPVPT